MSERDRVDYDLAVALLGDARAALIDNGCHGAADIVNDALVAVCEARDADAADRDVFVEGLRLGIGATLPPPPEAYLDDSADGPA